MFLMFLMFVGGLLTCCSASSRLRGGCVEGSMHAEMEDNQVLHCCNVS